MGYIELDDVTVNGTSIRGDVACSRDLRRFFTGKEFVVDYDVDVSAVPESLAVIPILGHVCPVAWANGAEVRVSMVDVDYLDALRDVGRSLVEMYPSFMQGGKILVDEPIETQVDSEDFDTTAMLFSGGVDSTASYIRHREEDPTLISIQGWVLDVNQPERWNRVKEQIEAFADERELETQFVRSNMLEFLDTAMLQAHYQRYMTGAWYSSVGQGLGMLSLCAPLSYTAGFETVYMAATHTEAVDESWGSHPSIDDRIRWAGTRAVHDGYDLTRQDKVELIADYVHEGNEDLTLRTCIHSEVGENCSSCEKCYRTAIGLLLAGLDPTEHGYDVDPTMFKDVRNAFERGEYTLSEGHRHNWEEFQDYDPEDPRYPWPEVSDFLTWLADQDLENIVARSNQPLPGRLVRTAIRRTPTPVWSAVYSTYTKVKRAR